MMGLAGMRAAWMALPSADRFGGHASMSPLFAFCIQGQGHASQERERELWKSFGEIGVRSHAACGEGCGNYQEHHLPLGFISFKRGLTISELCLSQTQDY
jgi:hypothetical protein